MNVSNVVSLLAGDAGGNAGAAVNKDEAGEGFGVAVKDAEEQHAGKGKTGATASRHAKAGGADKKSDGEDGDATSEDTGDQASGTATAGDVLGRILSASFLSSYGQAPVQSETAEVENDAPDGETSSGEFEERIVISTVADLANPQADDQPKRVALRVIGMETHFEPQQGASRLIDVEPTSDTAVTPATAVAALGDGAAKSTETARPAFAEILQRLDAGRADRNEAGDQTDAGTDRDPQGEESKSDAPAARASVRQQGSAGSSENGGVRAWTPGAARSDTARDASGSAGQTTGQIINAQLAERIIGAFAEQSSTSSTAGSSSTSPTTNVQMLRLTAGGAALKTLSIQLEPQDLGRVDVSMRLVDGRLTVELAASEPSTAATLAGDRHGLRKILEHAGFALDDAAITIVARDTGISSASQASNGETGDSRQSSSQGQAFGNSSENRRDADERSSGNRRSAPSDMQSEEAVATPSRRSGSVYL